MKLKWIECDGGPHMVIERRLIPEWSGPSHDGLYESTADIDDYAGTVPVGDGHALVLCEDIARSCWIPSSDCNGGFCVVYNYAEPDTTDDDIVNAVTSAREFRSTGIIVEFRDGCAYLMPACDYHPGDVYVHDEIHIDPGTYVIGMIPDRDYDGIGLRIFRLAKK